MMLLSMTVGTWGLLIVIGVLAVFAFIASSQGDGSVKNTESKETNKPV